jgi:hypothetical protein
VILLCSHYLIGISFIKIRHSTAISRIFIPFICGDLSVFVSTFLGGTDETFADCLLPINVINNIIFILLWFWFILILVVCVYGLVETLLKMFPFSTHLFIEHHLQSNNLYYVDDNAVIFYFVEKFPVDVILILRLYEVELGNTLVGEIIAQLFLMYKETDFPDPITDDLELP